MCGGVSSFKSPQTSIQPWRKFVALKLLVWDQKDLREEYFGWSMQVCVSVCVYYMYGIYPCQTHFICNLQIVVEHGSSVWLCIYSPDIHWVCIHLPSQKHLFNVVTSNCRTFVFRYNESVNRVYKLTYVLSIVMCYGVNVNLLPAAMTFDYTTRRCGDLELEHILKEMPRKKERLKRAWNRHSWNPWRNWSSESILR